MKNKCRFALMHFDMH